MVADYFTKPLQGVLFYKFRDQILGLVPMETIHGVHRSVLDLKKISPKRKYSGRTVSKPISAKRVQWKADSHPCWADVV
jgi:hypothetical protein